MITIQLDTENTKDILKIYAMITALLDQVFQKESKKKDEK